MLRANARTSQPFLHRFSATRDPMKPVEPVRKTRLFEFTGMNRWFKIVRRILRFSFRKSKKSDKNRIGGLKNSVI
jgi:hypothetical protein